MNSEANDQVSQLEAERGRALVRADWTALANMLGDDLVHIHTNGQIENKSQYLETVRTKMKFLEVERVSLLVRSVGNVAIATGTLRQKIQLKDPGTIVEMHAVTTQVWVRVAGQWRQNSFQATRIG